MVGRKPKPTNLKILNGNPGKRALNKNEPKPDAVIPDPPGHLNDIAIEEWHRMSKALFSAGLLSAIDASALAAYCQTYARWAEAEEGIKESGLMIKTTNGNVVQSPLVGIANKALTLMHKFLTEFGMTPSSRSRVSVTAKPKANSFEEFG